MRTGLLNTEFTQELHAMLHSDEWRLRNIVFVALGEVLQHGEVLSVSAKIAAHSLPEDMRVDLPNAELPKMEFARELLANLTGDAVIPNHGAIQTLQEVLKYGEFTLLARTSLPHILTVDMRLILNVDFTRELLTVLQADELGSRWGATSALAEILTYGKPLLRR